MQPTLAKYSSKRMIVMTADTRLYDAVRALEANHVGAVLVEEEQNLAGIVTDRDLAVRVIGYELDPSELTLRDVMSVDVAALPVTATEAEAMQLMLDRHVRRIPVVNNDRIVGLVTMDDLILEGAEPKALSDIVRAQLSEPAPLKDKGDVHPRSPVHGPEPSPATIEERAHRRHTARAAATYTAFLRRVMAGTGIEWERRAESAVEALLAGVLQRITRQEGDDLMAQLPVQLQERLSSVPRGPNRNITREWIEREISTNLHLAPAEVSVLVTRLGRVVRSAISAGEIADITAQLPQEMKAIFS